MSSQQTWQFVSVDPGGSSSSNDKKKRPRKKRVSKACVRCRKHKLRCDTYRPCMLCVRSDVPCIDAEGQSPQARRQTSSGQQVEESGQSQQTEEQVSVAETTEAEQSAFSPGWTAWEPIDDSQNMDFAKSGCQFGVSQDASVNPGEVIETENTAEAGGESELQFDGNWDWSTGQFLMPELWPKR